MIQNGFVAAPPVSDGLAQAVSRMRAACVQNTSWRVLHRDRDQNRLPWRTTDICKGDVQNMRMVVQDVACNITLYMCPE
jgi:hypothetical protein